MRKYSNLLSLLLATPLAFFLFFLFCQKRNFNISKHLVANFYFALFSALVFLLLAAPAINFLKHDGLFYCY